MNFKSSLLYASRIIFSKSSNRNSGIGKKSLIGSMICIGISLIPLVAVLVISNGMVSGITGRMINLGSRDLSIYISSKSESVKNLQTFVHTAEEFNKVQGITDSFAEIQSTGLALKNKTRCGATIRAVQNDLFTADKNYSSLFKIVEGSAELSSSRDCILGTQIAEKLNVHPGDSVNLVTVNIPDGQKNVAAGNGDSLNVLPRTTSFKVKGIVSSGYQELDSLWFFIPLETGFKILPAKSSSFIISLSTNDTFTNKLYQIQENVQQRIYGTDWENSDSISGAYIYRWDQINKAQYENFASTKILLLLIMLLIVLVASVNISSALIMIVMERKKEIAILKSVGASSSGISLAFLATGFGCGLGGVLIGIPLGLLASVNINGIIHLFEKILNGAVKFFLVLFNSQSGLHFNQIHILDPAYYLQEIPIVISFSDLFIIVAGTLLLSLLVSLIPSVKAGREKPMDTMRGNYAV